MLAIVQILVSKCMIMAFIFGCGPVRNCLGPLCLWEVHKVICLLSLIDKLELVYAFVCCLLRWKRQGSLNKLFNFQHDSLKMRGAHV